MEKNRRWSSRSNLTLPLSEDRLYFVAEDEGYGKVQFVEDASLKDDTTGDFYVEYDDWILDQTRFRTPKDIAGTGIRTLVSGTRLLRDTR